MTDNINHDYITSYIRTLLPHPDELLSQIEEKAHNEESYVPIAEPETAQLLRFLIDIAKPKKILEIGTGSAYSSIIMAKQGNAHITTIERYEKVAAVAAENIAKAGLASRITLCVTEASQFLENTHEEFDMIFLDGAKAQYPVFLPHLLRILKKGGVLVSDNVLYKGMTAERSLLIRRKITIVKRLRIFLKALSENPDLTTSIIPIGDGVAVSYKKQ